jgi:hypothetical protein
MITSRLQLIMEKKADKCRENLLVINEIALLILDKKNRPNSRKIIFTARSARDIPN